MEIYLEHPVFLWLLAVLVPLVIWVAVVSYALAPRWKRITSAALRIVALALVVLAISRPVWRLPRPDQTVVFALDISDSVEKKAFEEAVEHIETATRTLEAHQRAALVVFGGRAVVRRALSSEPIDVKDDLADTVFDNPGSCNFYVGPGLNDIGWTPFGRRFDERGWEIDAPPLTPDQISECDTKFALDVAFPGWIDDVRIYDEALSSDRIAALYAERGFSR